MRGPSVNVTNLSVKVMILCVNDYKRNKIRELKIYRVFCLVQLFLLSCYGFIFVCFLLCFRFCIIVLLFNFIFLLFRTTNANIIAMNTFCLNIARFLLNGRDRMMVFTGGVSYMGRLV